jgi:hypothetical protein
LRWQARALDEFDSAVQVARRDGVTLIGDGATDDRRVAHHPRCATLAAGLTYLTMGHRGPEYAKFPPKILLTLHWTLQSW